MNTTRLLSTLTRLPLVSDAARWYADQFPEGSVVRIRLGHGSGLYWRRRHRYVHGYWIGHYELPIQNALKRELRPGQTFFDLGANAGFFSLIASQMLGDEGRCIAFEPSPENCENIRDQIQLNGISNVTVVCKAVSNFNGLGSFTTRLQGSSIGRLAEPSSETNQIPVKITTIDHACERYGAPDFIKMDIEGAEVRALEGAPRTLREVKPVWLIELHGAGCEHDVKAILLDAHYALYDLRGIPVSPDDSLPNHLIAKPYPEEFR